LRAFALLNHFFLKPAGHLGETAVTFLVVLPFTQVMLVFLAATVFVAAGGVGATTGGLGSLKLTAN
jgi:hypothetical protein